MLVKELKHLEAKGIVSRTAYATVPPKVEYSLTDIGETISPVISSITEWGRGYIEVHDGVLDQTATDN